MLMPKYSLRQALIVLGLFAVLLTFLGAAWRGSYFAVGIASGLFFSIVPVFLLAGIYWTAYGIARLFNRSNLLLLVVVLHSLLDPSQALAFQQLRDSGQTPVGLIPPGAKGHDIDIESVGDISNGRGYATIWVTIKKNPPVPRTDDETFTVFMGPHYQNSGTNVLRSATIPAGKTSVKVELFFPLSNIGYIELSVSRGSNQDLRNRIFSNFYSVPATGQFLSSIWIDSKAKGMAPLGYGCWRGNVVQYPSSGNSPGAPQPEAWPFPAELIPPAQVTLGRINLPAAATPTQPQNFLSPAVVNPQLLSPNWIGITAIDIVFIRQEELNRLKKERPELCLMLERWTSVGGTLVVFDLKDGPEGTAPADWKNASKILPLLLGDLRVEEIGQVKTVWLEASAKMKSLKPTISTEDDLQFGNNISVYNQSPEEELVVDLAPEEQWIEHQLESAAGLQVAEDTKFLMTPHARGRIIAVQADFKKWQDKDWKGLRYAIQFTRGTIGKTFASVYGSSSIFSIPGIGEPPLQVFQILVGMFVLVAGPGVYWTLKRSEKLQLFFFVVPVVSLLTSLLLFGYIVIADGFESYGRVQSVTWVDHQTRSSSTSANATYYHNRRPQPYEHPFNEAPINNEYTFRQGDQSMEVQGGQIAPRTQHRFENVTSQPMEGYIKLVARGELPNSKPVIHNRIGAKVRWVAFRTKSGWLIGENIDDQQNMEAQEVKAQNMTPFIESLKGGIRQLSPEQRLITASDRYGRYYGYETFNQKWDLVEQLRRTDLKVLEKEIGDGEYLAIMERHPLVEKQLQKVIFKNQLHIVVGRW